MLDTINLPSRPLDAIEFCDLLCSVDFHLTESNLLQAFVVNDVEISPDPKTLLFEKHIEYIANHGNDKDDYVS